MNLLTDKTIILFRKFLIPSLLSAAAISIFQLVDTIAVGQGVGADGVAAIAVVTPLYGITSFVGVFIGIGASEKLMPLVKEYGNVIIGCFPFFFFAICLACIVRIDGAPDVAMWAVAVSGIFNAVGDYLLVFPFRIGTGIAGAAIATVLGNAIQVIIFVVYLFSKKSSIRMVKPYHWIKGFRKIAAAGFSTGFMDIAYICLTMFPQIWVPEK